MESINNYLSRNLVMESVAMGNHYSFYNTCDNMDWDEVQNYTHWDEYCSNDYCIEDEYLNNGIYIIPYDKFKQLTQMEPQPEEGEIEYCAYNSNYDILFAYTKDDIHWFYQ